MDLRYEEHFDTCKQNEKSEEKTDRIFSIQTHKFHLCISVERDRKR